MQQASNGLDTITSIPISKFKLSSSNLNDCGSDIGSKMEIYRTRYPVSDIVHDMVSDIVYDMRHTFLIRKD